MGRDQGQCSRRQAVEASGLPDRPWPCRLQALACFVRQAGDRRVVDRVAEQQPFVTADGFDIGSLALEVDRVLGVDPEIATQTPARSARGW